MLDKMARLLIFSLTFPVWAAVVWFTMVAARPATVRAYGHVETFRQHATMTDEARRILFGQTAQSTRAR